MQPVKDVEVIPVYEIISSSIFKSPYSLGNPFVFGTVIVVSDDVMKGMIVMNKTIDQHYR